FLDFYSLTNAFSNKLEKDTLSRPEVVAELASMLCYRIDVDAKDADAKESRAAKKRYQVLNAPALVFLDPDGSLRDQITGYFAAEPFLAELRRIKANERTFSDLRARIARQADDLDSRWELATKLRAIGDVRGYEQQVAEIRERDPDGHSRASRRMHLSAMVKAASVELDLE